MVAFNSIKASGVDRGNSVSNDISKKPGVGLLLSTKYDLIRIGCFVLSRGLLHHQLFLLPVPVKTCLVHGVEAKVE